ncbi:hypothetical protein HT031_002768 [Scenedesmus sp. PABB004]|nr:hypothetical protein HT031_002768 [Scenedesmus sp. PABB004]
MSALHQARHARPRGSGAAAPAGRARRALLGITPGSRASQRSVRARAGDGSDSDKLESMFLEELKRRGLDSMDGESAGPGASTTTTSKSPFQTGKGSSQGSRQRTRPAGGDAGELGDQRQRSIAMVNEGLEGLIPRAAELLKLGGSVFLAFAPFIVAISLLFGAIYAAFGDAFVHGGDRAAGPPPYVDPTELLSEPTVDAMVPFRRAASGLPVVVVRLRDTAQVPATPEQAALTAKGPPMTAELCTCGGPGGDLAAAPAELHVRGSSSVGYAKKSFALKLLDQTASLADARAQDVALLGMPAASTWILHGPENDRSLGMRNWLAMAAFRRMGRYASRTRYVELLLNTEPGTALSPSAHYAGVYLLMERPDRGPHRVNVSRFNPDTDLSGGYLLAYENDNIVAGDVYFETRLSGLSVLVEYPGAARVTEPVIRWLTTWAAGLENALLRSPLANTSALLDLAAAVDYFLHTELTKNPDGYRGSIKMHKDAGGPLVMGPPWDYNEAFGMCCGYPIEGSQADGASNGTSGGSAVSAAGWRFNICQDRGRCLVDPQDGVSAWYRAMWQEAGFRTAAAGRWAALRARGGPLSDEWLAGSIAGLKRRLAAPGARNFARWSAALNSPAYGPPFASWAEMLDAEAGQLQAWVLARARWLDAALSAQADAAAGPAAYLSVGYVGPEPPLAGASDGPGALGAGAADPRAAGTPVAAASGQPAARAAQPLATNGRR